LLPPGAMAMVKKLASSSFIAVIHRFIPVPTFRRRNWTELQKLLVASDDSASNKGSALLLGSIGASIPTLSFDGIDPSTSSSLERGWTRIHWEEGRRS
jgi:hypothetical protein